MASSLNIVNLSGQYPSLAKGQFSGNPQGLIIHHTGGHGTPQGIASGWVNNGLGAQYIIGRDGTVYQMVPDGQMANHIMPSWGAPSTRWATNRTALGVELIANNDGDVTPAQTTAATQLSAQLGQRFGFSPETHVLGHGDVNAEGMPAAFKASHPQYLANGQKNPNYWGNYVRSDMEGRTAVNALHAALTQADVRTANPLGGPNGINPADYTNGAPNSATSFSSSPAAPYSPANLIGQHSGSSAPPTAPRSFSIPALPSSSPSPSTGVTFSRVISGGGDAPLVVQGTDGQTYTVAGDQNLKYNNPTAMKYDQFAIDHGAIGSASRPGQTPLAIFPSLAAGQAAAAQRLFGDNSKYSIPAYKDMTLGQAIKSWAPGGVDGNNDPTNYINGIAKSLGISADTKLSDLSPAQQAQFIAAQQHQEGNKPQVITNGQGQVVSGSQPPSTPAGYNTVTDAQRTAMAALPVLPNSSGSPDDRGTPARPIPAPWQYAPPPVIANSSGSPDERGSQAMPVAPPALAPSVGSNALTEAQRNAMLQVPPAPVAPIPATRPVGLGATPATPPPQMATLATGKTIQVGKNYDIGGQQYVGGVNGQGVGTLTKVTSPLSQAGPNTIAGGIVGKAIGGALSTAGTNLQQAAGVAGKDISGALDAGKNAIVGGAQNAVNGVGGLLSNLFGGGGNAAPPPAVVPNSSGSPDDRGTPARPIPAPWNTNFAPTPQAATGNTIPSPPPAIPAPWQYAPPPISSSNNDSPSFTFPNPPSTPQGYNTVTDAQRTAMAALPPNYSQAPSAPTYQNVTVANPAYTTWTESYGDALQAAARTANPLGGPNGINPADYTNGAPNPPKPIPPPPPQTITVRRAVPAANSPAPQQPAPPPVQMVQLASGTMAPVGSISTNAANGYQYRVNADGTTTNITTGHTYGTPAPTNNLATMGAPQTGISDASEATTHANSTQAQLDSAMAYNAAHPGQVGEWMMGMPLAWRGTINPVVPRTLPGTTPAPAPAAPAPQPTPAPQSGANPVLSPPRFNGPPGQSLGANYPGPFPPNPSLNALSAWRQSHQDQPGQQSTGYGQGPNTQFPLNPGAGGQPQQPWWQGQGQTLDPSQHQPWHPFGIDPSQVDAWHQFDHGPQGQMGQWWQNHQQQPPVPVPPQPQPGGSGVNWPNSGQGQPLNPIGVPNRY